jgi:hypothetical protein
MLLSHIALRARRSAGLASVALGLAVLVGVRPASADCQPDGDDPSLIVCTDLDSDGFVAGAGVDDLAVEVREGAEVRNDAADPDPTPAIGLNDGSTVETEDGSRVVTTGDRSTGISVGASSGVFHQGEMRIGGNQSRGIVVDAGTAIVGETGRIVVDGDEGVGVRVRSTSSQFQNAITNNGRIRINGVDGTGLRVRDGAGTVVNSSTGVIRILEDRATGIDAGINTGVITNDGLIEVDGASSVGVRIENGNGSILPGLEVDDLVNTGRIEARGNSAIGIDAGPGSIIVNEGEIIGGFNAGAAIRFSDEFNQVTNAPGALIDGSASGVAIRGGAASDAILNNGRIVGDLLLGDGNDVYVVTATGSLEGRIEAGNGNDVVSLQGDASSAFDLDTFDDMEVFEIRSGDWQVSGSATLVSATNPDFDGITVYGGVFAPSGTVSVTGDYQQNAGSVFRVGLDADGTSDRLDLDGSATLQPGSLLELTTDDMLTSPRTWTILTATGGVNGSFEDVSGLGFIDVRVDYLARAINVTAARRAFITAATTSNQFETAQYLDDIVAAGPEDDMADVISQLSLLSADAFADTADQMHPEIYDAQSHASLLHGRAFTDTLLESRPGCGTRKYQAYDETRSTRSACGNRSWTPWGKAIGVYSDRDGSNGHTRYDVYGGGLALGADWRARENVTVSGAIAVIRSGLDFRGNGNGNLVSLELGAGAEWEIPWLRVAGAATYGHGWHDTRRRVEALQRRATSDFDSDRLSLTGDAGVPIPVGPVVIEPGVRLDYAWFAQENTDESGADSINLDVDEREESVFSTSPGVVVRGEFLKRQFWTWWTEWMDGTWRPEAHVRYRRTWVGADREVEASFDGAPSGTGNLKVDANQADWGIEFGARVGFQPLATGATVGLSYVSFTGDDTWIHRGTLDVRIPLN